MRHFFYDSLKRILMVFVATLAFVAPTFAATLPTGYTELEYIESTGTQYIDTGVTISGTDSVEYSTNFAVSDTSYLSQDMQVCGAYSGNRMYLFGWYQSKFVATEHSGSYDTNKTAHISVSGINANVFYPVHVSIGNGNATLTVNGVSDVNTNQTTAFENNQSLFLFARNSNGNAATFAKVRLKETTIRKNGVTVIDFIPARRNSDNVLGMYDTVNGVFYTNRGTGTFTAGPMACNGTRVNYTTATGTVTQNGTPTPTNPITPTFYTQGDMVLRKVGDVADSYDSTTGKITRRVGVVTLNGTEDWKEDATSFYLDGDYNAVNGNQQSSSHYEYNGNQAADSLQTKSQAFYLWGGGNRLRIRDTTVGSLTDFTDFLAAQYTAGTPVTVYYPLATETEEDWVAEQCIVSDGIKIATTKYTEDAFAGLMTTLSEAITKVTNIVDTTVQQATEIGNLATTKQDRPDTDCPAGRKCLLIMGADNKPHWYLIQE